MCQGKLPFALCERPPRGPVSQRHIGFGPALLRCPVRVPTDARHICVIRRKRFLPRPSVERAFFQADRGLRAGCTVAFGCWSLNIQQSIGGWSVLCLHPRLSQGSPVIHDALRLSKKAPILGCFFGLPAARQLPRCNCSTDLSVDPRPQSAQVGLAAAQPPAQEQIGHNLGPRSRPSSSSVGTRGEEQPARSIASAASTDGPNEHARAPPSPFAANT